MEHLPDGESAVATRVKHGDHSAFGHFFRETYAGVVSYARRLGVDSATAEDLAQEGFVRLWTNRARIDPSRSLEPLVFITVRNLTLNAMRDTKNRRRLLDTNQPPGAVSDDATHDAGALIDAAVLKERIDDWINRLPEREREAFTLSRFSGLSHQEIADLMGISKQTVGKHITNALRTLRDRLSSLHPDLLNS